MNNKKNQITLELLRFPTTDNLLLPGLLYKPRNKTSRVAIYLHGNGSSSVFYSVDETNSLGKTLTKKNISFFSFNNRGAHYIHKIKKITNSDEKDIQVGTAFELIKDCIKDIDEAINFLEKMGYKTFYLIGSSTGANKIIVYHYYKPRNKIAKYVLLSGGENMTCEVI